MEIIPCSYIEAMSDHAEDFDEQTEDRDERPGPEVTPELFREWRSPRFGRSNPERLNNPVWQWLVRSGISAYSANKRLNGPSPFKAGPGWCFHRFGQSSTQLADGRIVLIAGEHEDSYDPDFYIYNDVVIRQPDGSIDIFGYPRDVFPPTDFHTATRVGNRIILIGNLGYHDERKPGTTPVLALDLTTFAISTVETTGMPPGWIHKHNATLSEDGGSILIQRGKIERGDEERSHVENIDDWQLHLDGWRWERLTERRWQRWELRRKDHKPNRLWDIDQALWYRDVHWEKDLQEQMEKLTQEYGAPPDLDLAARLYRPDVSHEAMPEVEDEYGVVRIKVGEVIVRYVEDGYSIQMTVEGDLPQQTIDSLATELLGKLSALENTPYELKQL